MKRQLMLDDLTPLAAYAALRARAVGSPSFLLESAQLGGERWGRYTVIGWRPREQLTLDLVDGGASVSLRRTDLATGRIVGSWTANRRDVIALLRAHAFPSGEGAGGPEAPRVVDAVVGYVSFELAHALEPIPPWPGERRLAHFLDGATTVVFDARLQTVTVYAERATELEETIAALRAPARRLRSLRVPDRADRPSDFVTSLDDAAFARAVERAKEYIAAGDVFQVVLARSFETRRGDTDPLDVYRALRVLNPSPYLYYMELGALGALGAPGGLGTPGETFDDSTPVAIVGASPETLVRLEGGEITVRPLAGTRRRGATPEEDAGIERELLSDPKERAEHVMLVDLGRNDVGRVAEVGSVHVPVQLAIEHYSHVMHIVSEVRGRLRAGLDAWDVLAAAFPAGTLSGAPKVRAMQIIRELEGAPRGVYGGAIGYISRHGTLDLAIAIRTLVARRGHFEIGAGAGVVEGSNPELETAETHLKANAAFAAISDARPGEAPGDD